MEIQSVFCNNLDESSNRKVHMTKFFESLKLKDKVFRFKALHGAKINNPNNFQKGKIGNLTSQMSLWNFISKQKKGWYMIMEDDLTLDDQFVNDTFIEELQTALNALPKKINAIHLTRNKSKIFDKKFKNAKLRYKVIGKIRDEEIRKCSLIYPWSTLTGAYLLTPKAAKRIFRYAYFSVKYAKYLPFKKFNTDILMTRVLYTTFFGAMIKCFTQNNNIENENRKETSILHRLSLILIRCNLSLIHI